MSDTEMQDAEGNEYLYFRNLEDCRSIIKTAKLDERNLTPMTQALYYPSADTNIDNIKLLELDEHLLGQIRDGQTLHFKGGLNEKAVLCTDERTYDIKAAEISNSLLLVPELKFAEATTTSPLKSPRAGGSGNNSSMERSLNDSTEDADLVHPRTLEHHQVLCIFNEYIECREIKPRFRKMGDLLQLTRFSGPENEEFIDHKLLFTFEQLLDTVQSSRMQFMEGLIHYRAFEYQGYMRVCECEYEYRIVNLMLGIMVENSWPLDEVELDETLDALEGIAPRQIVEGLFYVYTTPSVDKQDRYTYKEDLVARIIAQNILQPGLKFHIDEFMCSWQEALPEGMKIQEAYLRGYGIFDREGSHPCIRSLNEDNLPMNIHERMKLLFKMKSKWTLDEIEPYIECFTTPALTVSSLLAKHARSLTEKGVRYYVTKH